MAGATASAKFTGSYKFKLPDKFTNQDWVRYLISAVRRETKKRWQPKSYVSGTWVRAINDRVKSGVEPIRVALMLDALALDWRNNSLELPWRLLSPERIYRELNGRPAWVWRAIWFARFAASDKEVDYYRFHLLRAEIALAQPEGVAGRANILLDAKKSLLSAENRIAAEKRHPLFRLHIMKDEHEAN